MAVRLEFHVKSGIACMVHQNIKEKKQMISTQISPLDEAIASRAAFVVGRGTDGRAETKII
jgi:hypothetical protein